MKEENLKLYKASKLEWAEATSIKHVVAVDLRQVSDIIKPNQVKQKVFSILHNYLICDKNS